MSKTPVSLVANELLKCRRCGEHQVVVFQDKDNETVKSRCLRCWHVTHGKSYKSAVVKAIGDFIQWYKRGANETHDKVDGGTSTDS